jgi:TP901 family phage tail tape measure protein
MAQALTGQLTLDVSGFVGAIRQAIDQARQFATETGKSLSNVSINVDANKIKEGFASAEKGAKQAGQNIGEAVSEGVEQSLVGAKTAFSKIFNANQLRESVLAATGALNDVVNVGNQYEATLAAVGAVTGQSGDALNKLGDRGRDLAKQFGGSASDQLKSFQGVLSKLGPQVADNADALTLMATNINTLSAASGDDAATSMNAIVDTMLQLGLVTGDANKDAAASTDVMNALAASAKVGAAEIPQVAQSMLQVGVAAKGAGLDVSSTTAAIQVLAVGGKTGSEAGIALRNVLGLLQKASGPAEESLKKMGTSSKELGELLTTKGLDAALAKVKGGMDGLGSAAERNATLMTIFGTENSAAAGILLDNVKTYKDFKAGIEKAVGEGAAGADGAVAQANARLGTGEAIMKRLKAQVEDVFISIQQTLGSGVSAAIGAVNQLAPTLTGLAGIKSIIPDGAFTAISSNISKLLLPAIASIAPALVTTSAAGTLSFAGLGAAATAAWAAITGPVGLIIAGIAAVGVAVYLAYQNIAPFKKFIDDLVASFLAFVNDAGQKFQQLWKDLAPLISEVGTLIKTVAGIIVDIWVAAFQAVASAVGSVVGWLKQFIGLSNDTKSATQGAGESVSFLTRAFDFLRTSIETVRAVVAGVIGMFQSLRNTISDVGNALASGNLVQAASKLAGIGSDAGAGFSNGFNQKASEISLDKAIQGVQGSLAKVSEEYSKQLDDVKKKQGVTTEDQKRVVNARLTAEIQALQQIQSVQGLTADQGIRLKKFATEQEAALRKKANDEIAALDSAALAKSTQDRANAIKDGYESLKISASDLRKNEGNLLKKQVDDEKKAIEQRLLNAANNKALTAKQAKEIEQILESIGKKDGGGKKDEKKAEDDLAKLKEENEKRIAKLRQSAIDDENQRKVKSLEDANAAELRLVDEQIGKRNEKLSAELRAIETASEAEIKAIQRRFAAEITAKDDAAARERDNGNDNEADKLEAESAKLRIKRDAEVGEARKKTEERVESERKRILENGTEFERELLNKRLLINQQYEFDRANLLEEIKRKKRSDELKTELDAVRSQADLVKAKDAESAVKRGELKRQELEKQQELELLSILGKTPQAEAQRNRIKQKYVDLLAQERIKSEFEAEEARISLIENASERELQLSLLGLQRKRDAELATVGNNSRARLDAELQYQEQRYQLELEYLRRTNTAVSFSFNVRENLLKAFNDKSLDEAENKKQQDLDALKKEEQDLLKSLQKREISYVEYLEKLEELKKKRIDIEKQGAATVDLAKAFDIESGIAKMNESLKKFNPQAALNRLRLGLVEAVKATFTEQQKLLDGTANRLGASTNAINANKLKAERLLADRMLAVQEGRLEDVKRIDAEFNATRDVSAGLEKSRLETQGKLYEQLAVTAGAQFTQLILQGENAGTALLKVALDQLQSIVPLLVAQIFGQSFAQLGPVGGAVASGLAIAAFQGLIAVAKSALGFKTGVIDFDGTEGQGRGNKQTLTLPNMGSDPDKYLVRIAEHETIVPKDLTLRHKDLFQFMFQGGNPLDYYRPTIQREMRERLEREMHETVRYVVVNVQQAGAQAQSYLAPMMQPLALSAQNFVATMPSNSVLLPAITHPALTKQPNTAHSLNSEKLERALDRTTERLERVERALNFEPTDGKIRGELSVRGNRVAALVEQERRRRTY